jgi:Na+/H+-dicarboxylate symporter
MKFFSSLLFRLVVGLTAGIIIGLFANEVVIHIISIGQALLNQLIMFCIPLIILGFITHAIAKMGSSASRLLGVSLLIAYLSGLGAAIFSLIAGYGIIPHLNIDVAGADAKHIPDLIFNLTIPQIMPVMTALILAILTGLAAAWNKAVTFITLLEEFQKIVISIVTKVVIPILPFFIAFTFAKLAYTGVIVSLLPIFLVVVIVVVASHFIWITVIYGIAAVYSKKNPLEVIRHYGPVYLTALGTMSSAATLPVALQCAGKSKVLRKDIVSFGIPLFTNIHLCGSVLTLAFFVMVVSQVLYGQLPLIQDMLMFCILLGIFGIAAPGVPGGTVMASLGLITSILGFDAEGIALVLTIFALQDSFGTACNVTGDGALTMILSRYAEKRNIGEQMGSA